MRRSRSLLLAVSLSAAALAGAATRPHYGGVLRVESRSAAGLVDPALLGSDSSGAQEALESLVFENLVTFDDAGALEPKLGAGWQHSADYKRWEIEIRAGVKFQNGQSLTAAVAAESLRHSLGAPETTISAEGGHVILESAVPMPNLIMELAKPRNAIAARAGSGELSGTGPFKSAGKLVGDKLVLTANDDYWDGRPYVDGIEVMLRRSPRDQAIDMELGKADVVEVELDQARQAQQMGERVVSSEPSELLAIVFNPASNAGRDEKVRRALALSLDRSSICNVLLQRQGEPSGALLPQWMTGYAFLFPSGRDVEQAREEQLKMSVLILDYDFSDLSAKAIAERVAVNAREAGIVVQAVGENLSTRAGNGDAILTRIRVGSIDPRSALENTAAALRIQPPEELQRAHTSEQLYHAEKAMLADYRIVPIAHVPASYGLSPRVRNWVETPDGSWHLEEVWLGAPGVVAANAEGHP